MKTKNREAACEAVAGYRKLAEAQPGFYSQFVAESLVELARWQSDSDCHEAALAAACEAVDIYRKLAPERPDECWPIWFDGLRNLRAMLGALGRVDEAPDIARELTAVESLLA